MTLMASLNPDSPHIQKQEKTFFSLPDVSDRDGIM